jgi:hypothetical protein
MAMDALDKISRFDDRRVIATIVARMRALGADMETLDVELSRRGPVDLDMLHDCLSESYRQTYRAA